MLEVSAERINLKDAPNNVIEISVDRDKTYI